MNLNMPNLVNPESKLYGLGPLNINQEQMRKSSHCSEHRLYSSTTINPHPVLSSGMPQCQLCLHWVVQILSYLVSATESVCQLRTTSSHVHLMHLKCFHRNCSSESFWAGLHCMPLCKADIIHSPASVVCCLFLPSISFLPSSKWSLSGHLLFSLEVVYLCDVTANCAAIFTAFIMLHK